MNALGLRINLVATLLLSIGLCLISCSSSIGPEDDDDTPPAVVTDLAVASFTDTTATLTWTASGDDDNEGTAARYELRRGDQFISPATWDDAIAVPGLPSPLPAGSTEFFTVTGLVPESRYFFALSTFDDEGNSRGLGNCVEVFCFQDAEAAFADTNLAAAVREQLALPPGPIYLSDLRGLVDLSAHERDISDLGGIEECKNLAYLQLHGNRIVDLTPLAGLTQLYDLSLAGNEIVDLSPLAGLAGLGHLWADGNLIADLTPLAGLHALTWLRIEQNSFSDLTPLAGLTGLEVLTIGGNSIADTSPLTGLTSLETLHMNSCGLTDLGFVADLSQLLVLHVAVNQLTDLGPVSGLGQLTYLQASYNLIEDLAPLLANTGLGQDDTVLIRENPLSAAALNEQIPALVARGVNVDY